MIDSTTLPHTDANTYVYTGDLFEVKGHNFNRWPSEIVCAYNKERFDSETLPSPYLLKLVDRTNERLIFQVTQTNNYTQEHLWRYFASPNTKPRTILNYEAIPPITRNLNILEENEEEMR